MKNSVNRMFFFSSILDCYATTLYYSMKAIIFESRSYLKSIDRVCCCTYAVGSINYETTQRELFFFFFSILHFTYKQLLAHCSIVKGDIEMQGVVIAYELK